MYAPSQKPMYFYMHSFCT